MRSVDSVIWLTNAFKAVRYVAVPIKSLSSTCLTLCKHQSSQFLDFSIQALKLTSVFPTTSTSPGNLIKPFHAFFSTPSFYPSIILCLLRFDLDGRFARSFSLLGRGDNIVGLARLTVLPELVSPTHNISHISLTSLPAPFLPA